ncbi:MAG: hypothetical protein HY335_00700 [Deinococcus sp.]|nr:hypothetical protein [Deinococcus sp.]
MSLILVACQEPGSAGTPPPPPPAAAVPRVNVTLVPQAEVVGRGAVTVSFGLPLPPGLLLDPGRVAMRDASGQEIPAHVRSLGLWRSLPPEALLCAGLRATGDPGIRSVLVQLSHTFVNGDPVLITVELNAARTLDVGEEVPVRDTWRLVNEGTYTSNYQLYEPSVYALLPPTWLACSSLTTLATVAGEHDFLEVFDQGQVNFFQTVINDFNSQPDPEWLVDFYTDNEPWLYDRAQVFYNGYIRTGRLDFLREAHRAAQHYMSLLYGSGDCPSVPDEWCRGFFSLKNPPDLYYKDSKYSYNESLATLYWLSGDPEPLAHLADVTSATRTEVPLTERFPDEVSWFTERHWANALLAPVMEYEVTGDAALADYAGQGIDALYYMQNHPLEGNPPNGCFNSHVEDSPQVSFSPWMSSLLAHALLRAYHTLGDERIPGMLIALGQCEVDRAIYFPTESGAPPYWMPRYIATSYGPPASLDGDPWSDLEHAIDVAYVTALGAYFSSDPAQVGTLATATTRLLETHAYNLDYWTRPEGWPENGRPLYRVNPPRKYSWWYKNSGAIGWVLGGAAQFPVAAAR